MERKLSPCAMLAGIAGVMRAVVSEPAAQRAVRVVKLVGRDPIVSPDCVVVQVVKQLRKRINILELRVGKERHRVVLDGVIELAGAIVGIDECGARPRCAVDRAGGKLNVFLIILPWNARGIQLPGQMRNVEDVVVGRIGVGVSVNAEIRARFSPDVIRLGRMDARARVEISRGVGNLRRVRITRRNEAVHERRGRIAEDLLRISLRRRLREVVILHRNHEDSADSLRRMCRRCLRHT